MEASHVPICEPSGEQTDCPGEVQPPDELVPALDAGADAVAGAASGAGAGAGAGAGVTTGAAGDAGAGAGVGAAMGVMMMVDSCRAAPPAGDAPEPEFPPAGDAATAFWHTGGVGADVPAF